MTIDYKTHLKKQLGFIERSCELYDAGYIDEAIRIAQSMRVLLHGERSLLSLMDGADINLFTQSSKLILGGEVFFLNAGFLDSASGELKPRLGGGPVNQVLPVSEWLDQVAYVLNDQIRLSRHELMKWAANKDGGAHVDQLPAAYRELVQDGALGSFVETNGAQNSVKAIINGHLVALRQMGYELLNSEELLSLSR